MYLSAIDRFPGLDGNPHLLAVLLLEADTGGLAVLRIGHGDLADRHRRWRAVDAALRIGLARLAVARGDVDAVDYDLAELRHDLGHRAGAALVLAREHDDAVALLDLRGAHHSTSGARLMIFMKPFERSSRTTGPKIRVPIGSSFLLTSTAALVSKRITLPSGRRTSLRVRTITARCTSPFFTRARGWASLTETTITSPTPATRRFEPPSTLMHWTRLAPLLSATSRLDCIWIIDPVPSQWLAGTRPAVPNSLLTCWSMRLRPRLRGRPRSPAPCRPARGRAPSTPSSWRSDASPRSERRRRA